MKQTKLLQGVLILALSLIGFSAFSANDNYPASMCVKWKAKLPTPRLNSSRIFNDSSSSMYVDCPVIRKNFNLSWYLSSVQSSWISAIDRHSNDSVCATLVKYRHTGFFSYANRASRGRQCTKITSSATSPFAEKLDLGNLFLGHSDYHLYISVRVPRRTSAGSSGLVTYNVKQ